MTPCSSLGPQEKDPPSAGTLPRPTTAVWNNLAEAVKRTVAWHRERLAAATDTTVGAELTSDSPNLPVLASAAEPTDRTDRIAQRTQQRYTEIHALLADGVSIGASCARGPVRHFARADTVEELMGPGCQSCWRSSALSRCASWSWSWRVTIRQAASRPVP